MSFYPVVSSGPCCRKPVFTESSKVIFLKVSEYETEKITASKC